MNQVLVPTWPTKAPDHAPVEAAWVGLKSIATTSVAKNSAEEGHEDERFRPV